MHIKYNEAVTFEIEGYKIHPRQDCKHCYGTGNACTYTKNRQPRGCRCVVKQALELKAKAIREGTPKPSEVGATNFSGEVTAPQVAEVKQDAKE